MKENGKRQYEIADSHFMLSLTFVFYLTQESPASVSTASYPALNAFALASLKRDLPFFSNMWFMAAMAASLVKSPMSLTIAPVMTIFAPLGLFNSVEILVAGTLT